MDKRLALVLAATLCACSTPPPRDPWPPDDAPSLRRTHDAGTALGPEAATAAVGSLGFDPASCLAVRVRILWLARLADPALAPLTTRSRLLVEETATPLSATPRATRGARVGVFGDRRDLERALADLERQLTPRPRSDEDERRARPAGIAPLGEIAAALPEGVTVSVEARGGGGALTGLRIHRPRLDAPPAPLVVGRVALPLDVGLVVRVARPVLPVTGTGAAPAPAPEETTGERVLLEHLPFTDRLWLLVLLPSPTVPGRAGGPPRPGLAFVVEVHAPPPPGGPGWSAHRLAVAECAGDLARADAVRASLAAERPSPEVAPTTPPEPGPFAELGPPPSLDELADPSTRRLALLELAGATDAGLAGDVAASGGDRLVAEVCSRVRTTAASTAAPTRGPALGWLVEKAALSTLAGATLDDERLPEVAPLLARRTGGLALRPSALLAAMTSSADLAAWLAALVVENRVLLEDGDPAVRARAVEWLRPRGLTPTGFDPFAAVEDRREALARADAAEAARRAGTREASTP